MRSHYLLNKSNRIARSIRDVIWKICSAWRDTAPRSSASAQTIKSSPATKGDPRILCGKESVSFRTAENYLGVSARQRQKLIQRGSLRVIGKGQNRRITTDSLILYVPPTEKTEPSRTNPNKPEL